MLHLRFTHRGPLLTGIAAASLVVLAATTAAAGGGYKQSNVPVGTHSAKVDDPDLAAARAHAPRTAMLHPLRGDFPRAAGQAEAAGVVNPVREVATYRGASARAPDRQSPLRGEFPRAGEKLLAEPATARKLASVSIR